MPGHAQIRHAQDQEAEEDGDLEGPEGQLANAVGSEAEAHFCFARFAFCLPLSGFPSATSQGFSSLLATYCASVSSWC